MDFFDGSILKYDRSKNAEKMLLNLYVWSQLW